MDQAVFSTKKDKMAGVAYLIVMIAIQFILVIQYAFGLAIYHGRPLNIREALNLIVNAINELSFFQMVLSTGIGICFFVILIVLIKKTIELFTWLKRALSKQDDKSFKTETCLFWLGDVVIKSYGLIAFFMIIVCAFNVYPLSSRMLLTLCMGPVALLVMRAYMLFLDEYSNRKIGMQMLYMLALIFSATVLFYHTWLSNIQDILGSIDILLHVDGQTTNDILVIWCSIADSACKFLIAFCLIRLFRMITDYYSNEVEKHIRPCTKSILIFVIAHVCLSAAPILIRGGYIEVSDIIARVTPCIPIITASVALFMYTFLTIEKEEEQDISHENANEEKADTENQIQE